MSWFPLARTVIQYVDTNGDPASGYVLKAYAAGTSTPIQLAYNSAGTILVDDMVLNSDGYTTVSGNVVIPFIDQKYKLALYPTQSAADANSGAEWITPDEMPVPGDFLSSTEDISSTTSFDSSDNFSHKELSGTITATLPDVDDVGSGFVMTARNSGTGAVTIAADSGETINDETSEILAPGDAMMAISNADDFNAIITRPAYGSKGDDIASAATCNIFQSKGELVNITGTTTITSFGTAALPGQTRTLIFDDAVTLTHNASTLIIPSGYNYTTSANDIIKVTADTITKFYIEIVRKDGSGVIGEIIDFAGTALQPNFLATDGSAVSRTTYAGLFAAIGTTWGIGDGSTTFNVPNLARRTTLGSGGSGTGTLGNSVGNTGGAETVALSSGHNGPHTHPYTAVHSGGANNGVLTVGGGTPLEINRSLTTSSSGSGTAHNNMQPSAVVYKQIRYQ